MKKNYQFSIYNFQKRGFSLIETLIAITILSLAIAGPLFTANRSLVAAEVARDQLIASHLAQEGIEYVRLMRDNVYLYDYSVGQSQNAWDDFLNTSGAGITGNIGICRNALCTLDPTLSAGAGINLALQFCPGSVCGPLYLSNGIYTQQSAGATETPFTRTIQVVDVSADDVRVISTVHWSFHSTPYSVTIVDHLKPWQ